MRTWLLAALMVVLQGCAFTVSHPRALLPIDSFVPLSGDERVWVEPGFEDYGERVASVLPAAIVRVEAAHYMRFSRTPRIYVCGSVECFKRYVYTPRLSAAVIPDNRLILSPNLNGRERDRLPLLLTHELAHLHVGQRIGHYHSSVPVWFHEGWASLTANGGGAEYATDDQAFAAIHAGRRVNLIARDTYDKRHLAAASGLTIHEFYRQSRLAVGWLKTRDETRFREFVLALQNNEDFDIAFWDTYGKAPVTALSAFYEGVLGDNPSTQAAPSRSNP